MFKWCSVRTVDLNPKAGSIVWLLFPGPDLTQGMLAGSSSYEVLQTKLDFLRHISISGLYAAESVKKPPPL
jgi:hypothetical protein